METRKDRLLRCSNDSTELPFGRDNVSNRDAVEVIQLNAFGFGENSLQLAERLDRADMLCGHTFQQMQIAFEGFNDLPQENIFGGSSEFDPATDSANASYIAESRKLIDNLCQMTR